ncbi:hypothetical protein MMC22_006289 [Lobaria immixta]|nr:hypothetical protein [Lobaria immixta]
MGSFSPYAFNEADPLEWRPGEDIAAGAFVGISLFLFVEVNVLILRAFKKRQGLYFWSMEIGSLGIFIQSVGIILKYFASPSTNPIWPLYTLFLILGWTAYVTAHSLVLYSRLHLVVKNEKIQRCVFIMILTTIFTFIIPAWVVVWPAYNTSDHKMSSTWSPRLGIVNRYLQIGYTITESIISGLYIWSLVKLLRLKSNVRHRRVMTDLIYVNVMVIAFDILQVTFEYANQVGLSRPIQNFCYILRLRLEFIVLNQLMDVAARGIRRRTFGETRYYHTANQESMRSHDNAPQQKAKNSHPSMKRDSFKDPEQTTAPLSIPLSDSISSPKSNYHLKSATRSGSDVQTLGPKSEPGSSSFDGTGIADRESFSNDGKPLTQTPKLGAGFFDRQQEAPEDFKHWSSGRSKDSKLPAFRRGNHSHRDNSDDNEDDEGKIDLHLWERRAAVVLGAPWFPSKSEA